MSAFLVAFDAGAVSFLSPPLASPLLFLGVFFASAPATFGASSFLPWGLDDNDADSDEDEDEDEDDTEDAIWGDDDEAIGAVNAPLLPPLLLSTTSAAGGVAVAVSCFLAAVDAASVGVVAFLPLLPSPLLSLGVFFASVVGAAAPATFGDEEEDEDTDVLAEEADRFRTTP